MLLAVRITSPIKHSLRFKQVRSIELMKLISDVFCVALLQITYCISLKVCIRTLTTTANFLSKVRSKLSRIAKFPSKIRGTLASTANSPSKVRADKNNRCPESSWKGRRNFVSSEISSKSHEKQGNSSKFVCITFAKYCRSSELGNFLSTIRRFAVLFICWKQCHNDKSTLSLLSDTVHQKLHNAKYFSMKQQMLAAFTEKKVEIGHSLLRDSIERHYTEK